MGLEQQVVGAAGFRSSPMTVIPDCDSVLSTEPAPLHGLSTAPAWLRSIADKSARNSVGASGAELGSVAIPRMYAASLATWPVNH